LASEQTEDGKQGEGEADEGTIRCGVFDLVEPIGAGGVAEVWRGRHRRRETPVAIKIVGEQSRRESSFHDAFWREVQAQAGLDHPGVVDVFDYGVVSEEVELVSNGRLAAGSPFFALEYAPAGSLRQQPPIGSWPFLQSMLLEVLDALAYAHARGIVHRDLKPDNLLYFPDRDPGRFKISDFGLAHAAESQVEPDSRRRAAAAGTPHYMPPEQIRGEWRRFGPWTDLYALGVIAYECVQGELPFDGESVTKVASCQLEKSPPELEPRIDVPDQFRDWIRRLLAKEPRERIRRAADAARILGHMPADGGGGPAFIGAPPPDSAPTVEVEARDMTETRMLTDGEWPKPAAHDGSDGGAGEPRPTLATLAVETTRDPTDDGEGDETGEIAPPIPEGWRGSLSTEKPLRRAAAGLELFGLREDPFVARERERDRIWEALRQVYETGEIRAVEIVGEAGVGTTRLADWMARRAHELGGARVLRAAHSRQGGPTEGLAAMAESVLDAWELDRQETYERAADEIAQRYDDPALTGDELDAEARALTEIIYPTPGGVPDVDGPRYEFESRRERYEKLAHLLEELGEERPLVVVLDDIHWGYDALGFVEHLMETRPRLSALVLSTARPEVVEEREQIAERLRAIRRLASGSRIELDRLEREAQRELVERALPLESEAVERIVDRSAGLPLFAIQLLGEWVAGDVIEPGDDEFRPADFEQRPAPEDLAELWDARIDRIVGAFGREAPEAREALELAGALGLHVDLEEWRAVCDRADVPASDALYEQLIRSGLARPKAQGWSFVHVLLVEELARLARLEGRWERHHRRCAAMLSDRYAAAGSRMNRRVAAHLREAGERERAAELEEKAGFD
jgi:hypothetical protein